MEHPVDAARWGLRWRLALVALAAAVGALLTALPFFSATDEQLQDVLTRWSAAKPVAPDVVLIDIDERSVADIGPWPWPRSVVANLIETLREKGVRLQVWDMYFPEPATGDSSLDAVLREAPRDVVVGQVIVVDPLVQDPPRQGRLIASKAAPELCADVARVSGFLGVADTLHPEQVGHITSTPDPDGRVRRVQGLFCDGAERYLQLVLVASEALTPGATWSVQEGAFPFGPHGWLERGAFRFPLDASGRIRVPFLRSHNNWPAISASRLLDPAAKLPSLQGRVVVVGATALGLGDTVSTPFHPTAPGVSIHAELMGAAFDQNWMVPPRAPSFVAALVAALIAAVLLAFPLPGRRVALFSAGLTVAILAPVLIALIGRVWWGILLPIFGPSVAMAACGLAMLLIQSQKQRQQTQRLIAHLESFLPRSLAMEIAQQNPSGESLGKPCHGVLLAVRIVGLERWAGAVDSMQALALVHAISSLADRTANLHNGVLEHVQGEIFLMAWPSGGAQDVDSAIVATRELFRSLAPLLERNELFKCPLGARAALETGSFLVGVAGSKSSRRPLLLGPAADTVLAMLALCDELASPILVGPNAARAEPADTLRSLGHFLLPDQAEPKPLFRTDA